MKCYKCKKDFPKESLINLNDKNYCPTCHQLKLSYDRFSQRVCEIFKLKMPGPILNKQRNNLIKAGFTDDTIIKTVEYCYYVKKLTRPTLEFVNAETVDEMKRYYKNMDYKENLTVEAVTKINYIPHCVPRQVEQQQPTNLDISKYLGEDVF